MAVTDTKIVISASDQTAAAFQSALSNFKKVEGASEALSGKLKGLLGGLAAGVSIVALKGMFDQVISGAAAMDDLAEKTGASVENLSKLSPVAKLAGIDMASVGNALAALSKRLMGVGDEGEGAAGKGAAKQLAELGLSARTAAGDLKDPAELMVEIAGKLDQYRDGMGKTQVAQNLFGKSGAELLPFLKDLAEYGELTARMTAQQAAEAEKYEKNIKRLTIMGEAWKKELAFGILPAMTALSEAFLDAKKESGTLGDKVKELKNDGTIGEFAADGARGIAMLIDAARHGVGAFKMMGAALNLLYEGGGLALQKLQNAVDTKTPPAMKKILEDRARSGKLAAEEGLAAAVAEYQEIPEMLSRVEEKLAAIRMRGGSASGNSKPALAGSSSGKAGASGVSDIEKAIQSSRERAAVLDFEANAEDKLTASQKQAVQLMAQIRDGKLTGTDAQRAALAVQLEAELANDRANEQRKIAIKQLEEENKALAERNKEAIKAADDLEKEVNSQRLANQEIGLTREQLMVLRDARMADAIATREQSLASLEKTSTSASEIEATKEQVEALRKLRTLRNDAATKEIAVEAAKKAEEEWKRTADSINHSLTDALLRGFESGKDSARNLRDTMYNMFRTLVLRPIIEAQMKPIAQAASQAMGGFGGGGILGQLGSLFGGGDPTGAYRSLGVSAADFALAPYAHGGSFMVGGSGGTDSQVVAFKASPDERVTIETPGQRSGAGGSGSVVVNAPITFQVYGDPDRRMMSQVASQAMEQVKGQIFRELGRGGAWSKAVGQA